VTAIWEILARARAAIACDGQPGQQRELKKETAPGQGREDEMPGAGPTILHCTNRFKTPKPTTMIPFFMVPALGSDPGVYLTTCLQYPALIRISNVLVCRCRQFAPPLEIRFGALI
jgi:hypothetical protein